jgi:hypothetical protein
VSDTYGGWIQTYTGGTFTPTDPWPSYNSIDIFDIAHALSLAARWTGHTRRHFSVAQHSVLVARWLKEHGYSKSVQLAGLMHDASEAYLTDVARPVKVQLSDYKVIEDMLLSCLLPWAGLNPVLDDAIKVADDCLLVTESRDLLRKPPRSWTYKPKSGPMKQRLRYWSHLRAEFEFLRTWSELSGRKVSWTKWLKLKWEDYVRA